MTTLRVFQKAIDPLTLSQATASDVEDFLATRKAVRTRHAYRSDLTCFYKWAIRRQLLTGNPVADTDSIRLPRLLPRPVSSVMVTVLIAAAPDEHVAMSIALAAYAGLRRTEISALTSGDISFVDQPPMLTVRDGKGNKDRRVPIHPELVAMFAVRRTDGHIVPLKPDTIGRKCAAHIRACGVDATLHQLRHTFGTELARAAGGNVVLVAKVMGHENLATSMGYIGWDGGEAYPLVAAMFRAS